MAQSAPSQIHAKPTRPEDNDSRKPPQTPPKKYKDPLDKLKKTTIKTASTINILKIPPSAFHTKGLVHLQKTWNRHELNLVIHIPGNVILR